MADRSGYIGRNPSDDKIIIARQTESLTSGQSNFVFTAGYDVGYMDVYVNGSKLINSLDYTANDTQNIIMASPLQSGDTVEFVAYKVFNFANPILEATGDFNVGGDLTAGALLGDGSGLSGVVTSITAGSNISINPATGGVTITG